MISRYILQTNLHNVRVISHQTGVLSNLRTVIFHVLFFLFVPVYEFSVLFYCTLNSVHELRIREERRGSSSHFYAISSAFEIAEDPVR
jgi:hypothetical protein